MTGPSCGCDRENKWCPLPTCPSPHSKDAGTAPAARESPANTVPYGSVSYEIRRGIIISSHAHIFSSRSMNEIKNLHYLPRATEPREVLFEDRTKAHADHVGQSFDWQSTAAVGVLKAVHFGEW